jgi:hypothetical protein
VPPKHKHLIRFYGLFSSRSKGKANKDGSLAKYGYRARPKKTTDTLPDREMQSVSNKASRRSWVRLIQKVYEVNPLVCLKSGSELKVIAVITDPDGCTHPLEVNKILECLKRNNAPPFDKVEIKAS